jgi:enoyl-CoA hydratase/carnithine racemase
MELLLTGDHVGAGTAHKWGPVNDVVDAGESLETADENAERLISSAPLAVQALTELAVRGPTVSLAAGSRLEVSFSRHRFETVDAVDGVEASRADREPQWRAT